MKHLWRDWFQFLGEKEEIEKEGKKEREKKKDQWSEGGRNEEKRKQSKDKVKEMAAKKNNR